MNLFEGKSFQFCVQKKDTRNRLGVKKVLMTFKVKEKRGKSGTKRDVVLGSQVFVQNIFGKTYFILINQLFINHI